MPDAFCRETHLNLSPLSLPVNCFNFFFFSSACTFVRVLTWANLNQAEALRAAADAAASASVLTDSEGGLLAGGLRLELPEELPS